MANIALVRAACLDGIAHGFLGRQGGVSTGVIAGLNVGFGAEDDDAAVAENRMRAADAVLADAQLVSLYQVHSPRAVIVEEPWALDDRPKADALVTKTPGLLLGIVTADCAPVLFADREAGIVGAAHAGWRGAHRGVIEATVEAMTRLGAVAGRICAAIGPCIAQASYEVDDGFRSQFATEDEQFFEAGKAGHHQFDLEAYVAARLAEAGLGTIEPLGLDTYSNAASYYSYRRATHHGEPNYGRQFSLIGLPA
ncbi:peptidoglycan editing factor PgeF [Pontixanthobacter aestiaquae]|uniref:Purine nucleoside phosphorylase n=1 Tax=Pontixanthobacter aestiaquae TaxID=1509367 RepID=A0A844Z4I4_9SPHN|nr:peptidoglycan editing factor PgeF [Pontixanthobacter aestiaquae]MDN3647015.1 peptidoglycan editing factor PgeF [Pontixanthobacter aestiaquae]MXO82007.1 peptidoglycan editing factor PgeF [Pontixanthobacter aestiaquae]